MHSARSLGFAARDRGGLRSHTSEGERLPIDFHQHFFFHSGLFFTAEVFRFTWECGQVTGNKMELRKKNKTKGRTSEG